MLRIGRMMGLLALASMMTACGGSGGSGTGGGGATGGTPTPTPTPTNTVLSNLITDGDFANVAAEASESFAAGSTTSNTIVTNNASLSLHYTAATQAYTLNVNGSSQTFAQSDVDASRSFPGLVFYAKSGGTGITDTLSLVRPSTAAAVPTYYVGAGGWTRATEIAGSGPTSRADTFTYGFPTATSAVPTSGIRRYAVDALAFDYRGGPIVAGTERVRRRIGVGEISVDFAAHTVAVTFVPHTPLDAVMSDGGVPQPPTYTGTGTIAADGTVSGQIDCPGCPGPSASLKLTTFKGRLYGPAAEEIGLTYAEGTINLRGTGALIGHQRGLFDHDVTDTDFSGQQTSLSTGGRYQAGTFVDPAFASATLGANNRFSTIPSRYYVSSGGTSATSSTDYLARDNAFSFAQTIPAEATAQYNVFGYTAPATADMVAADHRLYLLKPVAVDPALLLHYVQLGRFERREVSGLQINTFFASGARTPQGAWPTNGTGRYTGAIGGQYLPFDNGDPTNRAYLVSGTFDLTLNYATYALTGGLHLFATNPVSNTITDLGVFPVSGSGLDSNGVINARIVSNPNPAYRMVGSSIRALLYGPTGAEFGGQFSFQSCRACARIEQTYGAMVGLKGS